MKLLKNLVNTRTKVMDIYANTKKGVPELLYKLKDMVLKHRVKLEKAAKPEIPVLTIDNETSWHVTK